jgi:hypothetical protein
MSVIRVTPVCPVDGSFGFHFALEQLDAGSPRYPAQGEQKARLHRRQQEAL